MVVPGESRGPFFAAVVPFPLAVAAHEELGNPSGCRPRPAQQRSSGCFCLPHGEDNVHKRVFSEPTKATGSSQSGSGKNPVHTHGRRRRRRRRGGLLGLDEGET